MTSSTPEMPSADPVAELRHAGYALGKAANELYRLTVEFEGEGAGDAWQPGAQLRWLDLVSDELDRLTVEYEQRGKRPPAIAVMQIRAARAARRHDPDLWSDYHRLKSQIAAMEKWVTAKSKSVSAMQSALRGESTMSGLGAT